MLPISEIQRPKREGSSVIIGRAFPPTVRQFGSNSNNGMRGDVYDLLDVYLVHFHPVTQEMIPGVAQEWAVSKDGRTVYFRIHPEAKFNDGHDIESEDVLSWARLRLADQVDSIFLQAGDSGAVRAVRSLWAQVAEHHSSRSQAGSVDGLRMWRYSSRGFTFL